MTVDGYYLGSMIFSAGSATLLASLFRVQENSRLTLAWRLTMISTSIWSLGRALMSLSTTAADAMAWMRVSYCGSIWVAPLWLWVAYELTGRKVEKKWFWWMGGVCLAFSVSNFTPWFIGQVTPKMGFRYYDDAPGFSFEIWSTMYTVLLVFAHVLVFRQMSRVHGQQKNRLLAFFISGLVGFGGSATTFPLVKNVELYPFGVLGIPLSTVLMSYAVVKHRVMDIILVFRYATIYILFGLTVAIPLGILASISRSRALTFLIVLTAILSASWLEKRIISSYRAFVDRLPPFKGKFKSINQWAEGVIQSVCQFLDVENACVFTYDERNKMFMLKASQGLDHGLQMFVSPPPEDPLIQHLLRTRNIVRVDTLSGLPPSDVEELRKSMSISQTTVCAPFFDGPYLLGFISLGRKIKSGKSGFVPEDIQLEKMRFTLEFPYRHVASLGPVSKLILDTLGVKRKEEIASLSSHDIAIALNRLIVKKELLSFIPADFGSCFKSEARQLFSKYLKNPPQNNGILLSSRELSVLNTAYLATLFAPELTHSFNVEESYSVDDEKNIMDLARGAEIVLLVILAGHAGYLQTAEWAHDLRHPFTKGSFRALDPLLSGDMGPLNKEQWQALANIRQDAEFVSRHISTIVDPDLDSLKKDKFPLHIILESVGNRYRYAAQLAQVRLTVNPGDKSVRVLCDPDLIIHRVIDNLLDNAIRHTPAGGTVEIGALTKDKLAICQVRNRGGELIPANLLPHLFERGTQGRVNDRGRGGLGLYNVAKVVEIHGGQVWAESSMESGTIFSFSLPLA